MENEDMQFMPMPIYIPTDGGGGSSGPNFSKSELDEAARKFSKKPALQKAFKKGARWAEDQTPEGLGFSGFMGMLGIIAVIIFVAASILLGVMDGYDSFANRFSRCSPQTVAQKYNLIYRGGCHVGQFLGSKP